MHYKKAAWVTCSGGPGAGKTTVLNRLEEQGYSVAEEKARTIIAERKAKGLAPRPSPEKFARTIFERDIWQYEFLRGESKQVFFDRGIIDSLGMLAELGLVSDEYRREILARYPYHCTAFIFPPWEEIYHVDSERDQSYEDSVFIYQWIRGWYLLCGYFVVDVPFGPVDERCEFILNSLEEPVGDSSPIS